MWQRLKAFTAWGQPRVSVPIRVQLIATISALAIVAIGVVVSAAVTTRSEDFSLGIVISVFCGTVVMKKVEEHLI